MKKYIFLVIILVSALYFLFNQNTPVRIELLRIGTECEYPPNNWEESEATSSNVPLANEKNSYAEGYDIQIAKVVAEKLGARLEVKKIAWQELIPALQRREIDAIFSGMLDTDERKKFISFSETYDCIRTEYAMVVREDSKFSKAKRLNDFYGAVVTGQEGTTLDTLVEQIPGVIHVKATDTVEHLFEKLLNRDIDAIILNVDSGEIYEKVYPELMMIRFPRGQGFKLNFTGVCAGVNKKDTNLLNKINDVISGLSKRDRQRIMDRTLSREWHNL